MKRLRSLVGVMLGLALTVQGFAVAAAPVALSAGPDVATAAATAEEVPCHGATEDDGGSPAAAPVDEPAEACDCCDADCGGMVGCALGSLAAAPALRLTLPAPSPAIADVPSALPLRARPSLVFRPPIVSA